MGHLAILVKLHCSKSGLINDTNSVHHSCVFGVVIIILGVISVALVKPPTKGHVQITDKPSVTQTFHCTLLNQRKHERFLPSYIPNCACKILKETLHGPLYSILRELVFLV